ncbi:MAG: HPr family phosphocarrier protein [Veillonellaceae bacterium]|nr:HPr family phosphocarrier protein [Veillonellaceae bacterium]
MVQQEMTVISPTGLHARPAAVLVAAAAKCKSSVSILFAGKTINAKSVLNVLGGGISHGARIIVVADGEDEQAALTAVCRAIEHSPE